MLAAFKKKERTPGRGARALAADSTGLGEYARGEWFSFRFGRSLSVHQLRKLHAISECRGEGPGLIRAWALTAPHTADGPMLRTLLDRMETPLGPVLGDAAYAGRRNVTYVAERGGEPYFPPMFPWTARARGHPAWRRMILRYRHNPEVFHDTYRYRANVEGAFSAIKLHQRPFLRARSAVMQRREAGWRMIARNVDLLARARAARQAL
ncbi:MAG TPA: transposase [Thermoplasmata archaeon]|nr:transposase [Thermoplasmata archaeon]